MKKQKMVSLSIILVLMASMFVCLEGITKAQAQSLCPMNITPADTHVFQRNGEVTVDSNCHLGPGLYLGVFQARLIREIHVYTSASQAVTSGALWIKTEQWDVNGYVDQNYFAEIDDALTLNNMDDSFPNCPDTWDGVRYEVYYKVEWKYVPWPQSDGPLVGTTGDIDPSPTGVLTDHVVHNELRKYACTISQTGYEGSGGSYLLENVLGAPDATTGFLYTNQPGDVAYFRGYLDIEGFDEAYPECNLYDLYLYCGSWSGYSCQVTISACPPGGPWQTVYSFQSPETMGWVYCGELTQGAEYIEVYIENLPWLNGGNLEIDSIRAWGKN